MFLKIWEILQWLFSKSHLLKHGIKILWKSMYTPTDLRYVYISVYPWATALKASPRFFPGVVGNSHMKSAFSFVTYECIIEDFSSMFSKELPWGAWVAELIKHLTLDFSSGHDLRVMRSALGGALHWVWRLPGILSFSLCPLSKENVQFIILHQTAWFF